ncbi:Uma2 family endonuclease [Nocardioides stalactiti]|uniref:Uma2 family endonuclease n=1 Tax=Nocardioides stalactiti TaxID=2755356 RepID=UPI0016017CD7|nr:Uma2 family endonuclease [Nocardioides stalactiti]
MTAMTVTGLPPRREFTYADLELMPDDGRRYEIIDGVLIVSASPDPIHQRVIRKLLLELSPLVPDGVEPFFAPLDVKLAEDTVLIPDLLLARQEDLTRRFHEGAPLLAVEVLSPSTRNIDLTLKKARLEQAACQHYWVVDPGKPSITAWELVDGSYVEVGTALGEGTLAIERPVRIELTPARLIEP